MEEAPPTSFFGRFISDLDDNNSRVYTTVALLFYIVPVALISILLISAAVSDSVETRRYDTAFIALFWVAIVILPLMLTFGVFIVYRATYISRNDRIPLSKPNIPILNRKAERPSKSNSEEEIDWDNAINKALDWNRFLMPLCLLNMFITLTSGFLVFADLSWTGQIEDFSQNDIIFGYYDFKIFFETISITIPSSLFYMGLLGFLVQFLEMSRRRYVSRNLVPRFYLMSAFRLLQVMITVIVVYLFQALLIGYNDIFTSNESLLMLVTAFVVGMFPLQLLTSFTESIRERLGMETGKKLPITLINGIDNTLESLLQEENIDSIQILATNNVEEMNKRTKIPVKALTEWQRQAKLLNVLGTQDLIHRYARIGINDFDDLLVLAENMDDPAFKNDFTTAMRIKSDDEAIANDSFWRVLMQVLVREYFGEFPEKQVALIEARKAILRQPVNEIIVEQNVAPEVPQQTILLDENEDTERYVSTEDQTITSEAPAQTMMLDEDNDTEQSRMSDISHP